MKKGKSVMIALICLLAGLMVIGSAFLVLGNPQRKLAGRLKQGGRFLTENNYEEAIISFTAAIEIDPKSADAYLGRAKAYKALADISADDEISRLQNLAEADYLMAAELSPNEKDIYLQLAEIYSDQKRIDDLIYILRQGDEETGDSEFEDRLAELDTPYKDDPVQWSDPVLEKMVRQELGLGDGPVYVKDLDEIRHLLILGDTHIFLNREADTLNWSSRGCGSHDGDSSELIYYYSLFDIPDAPDSSTYRERGNITTIDSLWYFRNLKVVTILANHITDISVVKRTNLTYWNFWANDISDTALLTEGNAYDGPSEQFVEIGDVFPQ